MNNVFKYSHQIEQFIDSGIDRIRQYYVIFYNFISISDVLKANIHKFYLNDEKKYYENINNMNLSSQDKNKIQEIVDIAKVTYTFFIYELLGIIHYQQLLSRRKKISEKWLEEISSKIINKIFDILLFDVDFLLRRSDDSAIKLYYTFLELVVCPRRAWSRISCEYADSINSISKSDADHKNNCFFDNIKMIINKIDKYKDEYNYDELAKFHNYIFDKVSSLIHLILFDYKQSFSVPAHYRLFDMNNKCFIMWHDLLSDDEKNIDSTNNISSIAHNYTNIQELIYLCDTNEHLFLQSNNFNDMQYWLLIYSQINNIFKQLNFAINQNSLFSHISLTKHVFNLIKYHKFNDWIKKWSLQHQDHLAIVAVNKYGFIVPMQYCDSVT